MVNTGLLSQAQALADQASEKAEEYTGLIGPAQRFVIDHFGQNGLYAAYIVLAVILLFVISRIARLTFSTLKYLVIPAVALAFVASFFVPYSFVGLLPITVTVSSLFLLFRG